MILPRADLVCVGVNSLDTILRVPHFPIFNSKLEIDSCESLPGGQTATAAIACRRWGLQTRYVGKIGDDRAGEIHRQEFAREGVEAHLLEVADCASQMAFILVERASGERTILWKRDPRLDVQPDEIHPDWITRGALLHVDGHPSAPAAAAAILARRVGIPVTADIDNLYPGFEALLQNVDYLIGSREFPQRLTGIDDLFRSLPLIRRRFGCRIVGTTLGQDGVLVWDGDSFHYRPGYIVPVVDTTGAGDLFHAGFDYSVLQGWALDQALDFSCAAAALNCTAAGARGGIRSLSEIEKLLRDDARHGDLFDDAFVKSKSIQATEAP